MSSKKKTKLTEKTQPKGQKKLFDYFSPKRTSVLKPINFDEEDVIEVSSDDDVFLKCSVMKRKRSPAIVTATPKVKRKNMKKMSNADVENNPPNLNKCINKTDDYDDLFNDTDNLFEFEKIQNLYDQTNISSPKKKTENLNLETWQTCVIVGIEVKKMEMILNLKSIISDAIATCHLKDTWIQLKLESGTKVNIIAVKYASNPCEYEVNNNEGILVVWPDLLISGTTLMQSLFCMRHTILNSNFNTSVTTNKIMTIGILTHQLLQETLSNRLQQCSEIRDLLKNIFNRPETIYLLYKAQMTTKDTLLELEPIAEKIHNFIRTYVYQNIKPEKLLKQQTAIKENWKGVINSITDIEENVWCPRLGLKGKIDVSVDILPENTASKKRVIPLELKTGKTTLSAEHRGQVAIYNMMLKELGLESPFGLLLYIRDNKLVQVQLGRREERDLIILRNNLTNYLHETPKIITNLSSGQNNSSAMPNPVSVIPAELPAPICNPRFCKNCSSLKICSFTQKIIESDDKPIDPLYLKELSHLSKVHIDFIKKWIDIMTIELEVESSYKPIHDIWNLSSEERELKGRSISNLKVKTVQLEDTCFITLFVEANIHTVPARDFRSFGFNLGDYIIVSVADRVGIATGYVQAISKFNVSVSLDRNIKERYQNHTFFLDTYETDKKAMFLSSLIKLLEEDEIAKRYRRLIIDKEPPTFNKIDFSQNIGMALEMLITCNDVQQKVIYRSLEASDYVLINGLPGTGKTRTIVTLIEILVSLNFSVLVTSHTHSAVDNVLSKLLKSKKLNSNKIIRLGSVLRASEDVRHRCESVVIKNCKTVEEVNNLFEKAMVVGVTCIGSNHPLLENRIFDYCIVDECTQVILPAVLKPLFAAKKFILVGDPKQLSPLVRSSTVRKMESEMSLFEYLSNKSATIYLNLQYRMNNFINKLANHFTYCENLICGDDQILNATIKPKKFLPKSSPVWIKDACSHELPMSIIFIDTGNTNELNQKLPQKLQNYLKPKIDLSIKNISEALIVNALIEVFLSIGISSKELGIISPFRAQVEVLNKLINNTVIDTGKNIENINDITVSTIDQYQGCDNSVIIVSCVDSDFIKKETSILADKRRLNVAITRAKHKLILVGSLSSLKLHDTFARLLEGFNENQIVRLENEANGFDWNHYIQLALNKIENEK